MTAALRRDACPSLTAPMLTGDGWLARLTFTDGLSGEGLAGLAAVAARLGNGRIEVTSRGSLQLRGLAQGAKLAEALAPLGLPLAEGLPVVTSPLAGRDPASVVHQCGSGVSAVPNMIAMEVAGFAPTALFAGSWSQWCSDPSRPCAQGA